MSFFMRSWIKILCCMMVIPILGSCNSTMMTLKQALPITEPQDKNNLSGPFSGVWAGDLDRSVGSDRCTINRLGLHFELDRLTILGNIIRPDRSYFMTGTILENGQVVKLSIGGYYEQEAIEMTGQFQQDHVEGSWKSKFCQGTWKAVKVE